MLTQTVPVGILWDHKIPLAASLQAWILAVGAESAQLNQPSSS